MHKAIPHCVGINQTKLWICESEFWPPLHYATSYFSNLLHCLGQSQLKYLICQETVQSLHRRDLFCFLTPGPHTDQHI